MHRDCHVTLKNPIVKTLYLWTRLSIFCLPGQSLTLAVVLFSPMAGSILTVAIGHGLLASFHR